MLALFHQNEVENTQGGIERYLSNLVDAHPGIATLVTERSEPMLPGRVSVALLGPKSWSKWFRYCLGVLYGARGIRKALAARSVEVLEFSRCEYAVFAWLFPGRKVFTLHGPGAIWREHPVKRLIHDLTCFLLPFIATSIQVVGRESSGLPRPIRALFGANIVHIDAWYDDRFHPSPFPNVDGSPLVVFYSGRLTSEKNPELLFEIIRRARKDLPFPVEFRYFGADAEKFSEAGVEVPSTGLLDAAGLAAAIATCHVGILCSRIEGSPFAMIEALACGRCFVAPPLPGLKAAYGDTTGVFFADRLEPRAFLDALLRVRDFLKSDASAAAIAKGVEGRSQTVMARKIIDRLRSLTDAHHPAWPQSRKRI